MASRKSRTLNKRLSKVNEESPDKDGNNRSKPKKRKLSDMLGSQWSKEELERFYDAYRKYGKDWRKVAGVVRNRSIEMVEALYNMNRAYLSLPEGTASVVGLIAMMTDHYNIMEGSDSERESNDVPGISRKPQKRGRGKFQVNISKGSDAHVPDLLQFPSLPSSNGGLSLLRKKRSGGSRPRAVGKRTPRFPVSYLYDKHDRGQFVSPNKRGSKSDVDANDDEVAHGAVLVLAEALQRGGPGGSPQISHAPSRRTDLVRPSPGRNRERMQAESQKVSARFLGIATDEDCVEGSLGSREAENGDFTRDSSYMMDTEGVGTVEVKKKGKKFHGKKSKVQGIENNFDDVREACSGTEEGLILSSAQERVEDEVTDSKLKRSSPQSSRKRSRQLLFEDESAALDALCTLADVSMKFAPASTVESESSVQFKEDKRAFRIVNKSSIPEATSANRQKDKPKSSAKEKGLHLLAGVDVSAFRNTKLGRDSAVDISSLSEAKKLASQSTTKVRKGKGKSLGSKLQILKGESPADSRLIEPKKTEVLVEDGKKSMSKAKRVGVVASFPKQGRSFKPPEQSSSNTDPLRPGNDSSLSTVQVPTINQVTLPTKLRSRRKMDLQKALVRKELSSLENIGNDRLSKYPPSHHDKTLDLKEKLSHCLSSQTLRRWCAFEWFYSAIDYPWFAKREFVEYLNHVGLGHVPRLTRVEWGVIRSSLGKPRRLSQQFLREEKEKLEQYRESVRTHYTELRAGIREGLPTDLARPLSVGQRVIACHPKTREFHDGSVLTVDRSRCRIQFDRPELGVGLVMDIDCMPLNPLENMPEALRRQNIAADRLCDFSEPKMNNLSKDWKTGGHIKVASTENPETADTSSQMSLPTYPLNTLLTQAKGDTINAISQAKAAASEIVNAQKAAHTQPCTLVQKQAREADIRALSEVTRALDKKQALVLELKHMNDDVNENRKDGDNCLKDYEPFKRQYATVLVQLKEVNEQVASALTYLRQRNTYQGNSPPWQKLKTSTGTPVGHDQIAFLTPESGSHVVQILESSRLKGQTMVDIAVQAMSSLKEGEDAFASIGVALDSASNHHHGIDSGISSVRSFISADLGNGSLANQDAASSYTSQPTSTVNANGIKPNNPSGGSEMQIPKELVSSCVATLLMIQTCTERQYPPAEVAQILDSAVTSLQPCCSENLPIYREIQMCMGLVKNQILALIPT